MLYNKTLSPMYLSADFNAEFHFLSSFLAPFLRGLKVYAPSYVNGLCNSLKYSEVAAFINPKK